VSSDVEIRTEGASPEPPPSPGNGGRPAAAATEQARPRSEASPRTSPAAKGWQYTPHVVVFFSAACIMIIELVAGRLIARHLGSSLYTWTSIIGVILAGMSVGNYIGGRFSDKWKPEDYVGWLFLISSIVCLSTLGLNHLLAVKEPFEKLHWPMRVFTSVLTVFMMPALCLGTISPAMAKMALSRSNKVGQTIGSVYAWATVGSIVGTLATGFYLVALLGAQGVVLAVTLGLALIGAAMGPKRWVHAIWVLMVIGIFFLAKASPAAAENAQPTFKNRFGEFAEKWGYKVGLREYGDYIYGKDSDYQYIKVYEDTSGKDKKRTLRVLALDYLIHGYIDPDDPQHFEYDYELIYRDVARRLAKGNSTPNTFFLGGGSYTFPRWVLKEWKDAKVAVAEIDPMVVDANYEALGLRRDLPIKNYAMDARNAVADLPATEKFDLIFGDAFNDLSVPYHLTTIEFVRKLKQHMTPRGAYLMNIIDDWRYALFLGSMAKTLTKVFKNVYIFGTEKEGTGEACKDIDVRKPCGRETFVVAATDATLDVTDWGPGAGKGFSGALLVESEMKDLLSRKQVQVLTDDDSPVENLLQPVVRSRK
jgi:spermidine synthase